MSRSRARDQTRRRLLDAAFQEIYRKGYQAASLSEVLAATGVTKGALYHYFPSKLALGLAVFDECLAERIERLWVEPIRASGHSLDALRQAILTGVRSLSEEEVALGCPLANLAGEAAALEEGLRSRIDAIYETWCRALAEALAGGQAAGEIRQAVKPVEAALFIIASLTGARTLAKAAGSRDVLTGCAKHLLDYLQSLRRVG